jgi:hypothetical protein
MKRTLCLALAIAAPLAACNTVNSSPSADKRAVSARVLDESKRQEAAQTAEATASSAAGVASVSEGPKDQKPIP